MEKLHTLLHSNLEMFYKPMPGVCGVKGAPGVIGLNAMGDGVPAYPAGDGVEWKLPIGLGVNVPGLEAA
jgi:hypothetical protein